MLATRVKKNCSSRQWHGLQKKSKLKGFKCQKPARPLTPKSKKLKNFINIYSCPRSGTYLLQVLMNQFFSISFPVETQFIVLFYPYRFLWGNLKKENNRRKLLNAIYDFIELFTYEVLWSKRENQKKEKSLEYTLLSTRACQEKIINQSNSFPTLVQNIYLEYSRLSGKDRCGDKLSIFEPIPIDRLTSVVPNIKLLHIIRDGRDVYLSWKKTWHGPTTLNEGARLWVKHIARKRAWGLCHPNQYLEIRYEDLITDCESVLNQVADFIGEKRSGEVPNLKQDKMSQLLSEVGTHSLLAGKIEANNREKWRTEMTPADLLRFETIASRTLIELGYPCEYGDAATHNPLKSKLYFLLGKIPIFTQKLFWKRKVKYLLPLLIYVGQLIGISLPKIAERILAASHRKASG